LVAAIFVASFATVWFHLSQPIAQLTSLIPDSPINDSPLLDFEHLPPQYSKAISAAEEGPGKAGLPIQLARAVTPPSKQLERELKELLLARRINLQFNHDEIVTMYANQINLGPGIPNLSVACFAYFNKDCRNLDLSETAFLAGLGKNPNLYLKHTDLAVARRNEVLDEMRRRGMISSQDAAAAEAELINIKQN
jgi:penicillin-binding protein 1A